jgi:hypothetical protein
MLAGCAVLLALGFAIAIWPIFRQMLNFSNPMTKSYSFYVPVNHLNNVIEDLILSNPEYRPPSESEKIQQQTNSQERFFLLYLKETDFIYSFKTIEGTLSSVDQPSAKAVSRLILRGGRKNNPKNSPWEDICEFKSYWGLYPVATTDLIIPFENTFIAAITKKINN